ncbi:MAG: beta-ketoacyl-ACP synthase III [Micromonosporaceae bacterium]|nr:beta-ketoacyl-ACP synthase III [Micromonosporaceae bacterium]
MLHKRKSLRGAGIVGVGAYRPHRVVDNTDVAARTGRTTTWIEQRSGIVERRHAAPDETVADMAVEAATKAAADAGIAPGELGAVVVASMSTMRQSPGVAPEVAHRLGGQGGAFDLNAACAGYSYALGIAASMVQVGAADHVAVIGSDKMTDIIDPCNPYTAPLFGDGAGAMVIGPRERNEIGPVVWGSDGGKRALIGHTATWPEYRDDPDLPWPTMHMAGPEVFRWVIERIPDVAQQAVAAAGISVSELDAFVPHQANLRIIDKLAQQIGLPEEAAVARDIVTAGNTSAASIPLAVARLRELGAVRGPGVALLLGFGGGLTWAGQVVRLP